MLQTFNVPYYLEDITTLFWNINVTWAQNR